MNNHYNRRIWGSRSHPFAINYGGAEKIADLPAPALRHQLRKHLFLIPIISVLSYALERLIFWLDVVAITSVVGSFFFGAGPAPHLAGLKFKDAIQVEVPNVTEEPAHPVETNPVPLSGGTSGTVIYYNGSNWGSLQPAQAGQCLTATSSGNAAWSACPTAVSGTTMTVTLPSSSGTLATLSGTTTLTNKTLSATAATGSLRAY